MQPLSDKNILLLSCLGMAGAVISIKVSPSIHTKMFMSGCFGINLQNAFEAFLKIK